MTSRETIVADRLRIDRNAALFVGLFALAGLIHIVKVHFAGTLADKAFGLVEFCIYIGLITAWGVAMYRRLLPGRLRTYAMLAAGAMALRMIVRQWKYEASWVSVAFTQFSWYAMYPLQLVVSLMLFLTCLELYERNVRPLGWVRWALVAACALVSMGVLTNNVHHLMFSFPPDALPTDASNYTRGPVFVACNALAYGMAGLAIVLLGRMNGLPALKGNVRAALLILGGVAVYLTLLAIVPRSVVRFPFEFPEALCFGVVAVWEWLVRTRLIPTNERHAELFGLVQSPVLITDASLAARYQTAVAMRSTAGERARALEGSVQLGACVQLAGRRIRAGAVFWEVDLSDLNRLNAELERASARLAEENELIEYENDLAERSARIQEKERIYDEVNRAMGGQVASLARAVDELDPATPGFEAALASLSLEGAHVKRALNLRMMQAEGKESDVDGGQELVSALQESLRYLRLSGVDCSLAAVGQPRIYVADAIALYDRLALLLHACAHHAAALLVSVAPNAVTLVVEPSEGSVSLERVFEQAGLRPVWDGSALRASVSLESGVARP